MSFSRFSLSETMVNALKKQGYLEPSPVQSAVIPKALRGVSLLAQSETGSGKTHAYLVPLIERTDMNLARPQSIIVAPTRELARQIFEFARGFSRFYPKFRVRLYSSEADASTNVEGSNVPPQMIVGTPGRLKDILIDKALFTLKNVRSIVLDEADMLLDMGYFEPIEAIFAALDDPQTLVFSATLKQNLKDELLKFVRSDFEWENDKVKTASVVKHHLVDVKHIGTENALIQFLKMRKPYLAIIFSSTKDGVAKAHAALKANGMDAIYFTGSLEERERKRAIREIRSNRCALIVASDLLSRGIDIPDVTDVISLDLPSDLEFYYHRAGRSGRFGKPGDSWVFYNADSLERPKALVNAGVKFDYLILKNGQLEKDPVGLAEKTKFRKKKPFEEEELKEIKIAKAKTTKKRVEPMHKKKQQFAIEKVKRKYRRKAIQKSVRQQVEKEYRAAAQRKKEGND